MPPNNDPYDFLSEDADEVQYQTPTELYSTLVVNEEIILRIKRSDERSVREGLASAKYKANEKAKREGFPVETKDIIFTASPAFDESGQEVPDEMNLQVCLGRRGAIRILAVRLPDNEL